MLTKSKVITIFLIASIFFVSQVPFNGVRSKLPIDKGFNDALTRGDTTKILNTTHFSIYYEEGEEVIANITAQAAEDMYPKLTTFMDYTPLNRTTIKIDTGSGLSQSVKDGEIYLTIAPEWCTIGWGSNIGNVKRSIGFTFAHMLLTQKVKNYSWTMIPYWFSGGLTIYSEAQYFNVEFYKGVIKYLIEKDSLSTFDAMSKSKKMEGFYNQAYTIIEFMINKFGESKLHMFYEDIVGWNQTGSYNDFFESTFESVFGTTQQQFENEWQTYLQDEYIYGIEWGNIKDIQLTNSSSFNLPTSWHNNTILFVKSYHYDLSNPAIYAINEDGTTSELLTSNGMNAIWSPDGKKILFTSKRDGNYEIYTMNADGSNVIRLTNDIHIDIGSSWSPDGSKIAFTSSRSGNYNIYIMNTDGSNVKQLTTNPSSDGAPVFSPDGNTILFFSNRNGNYDLFTMDVNGSNIKQLTNTPEHELFPTYSPDGEKIVYYVRGQSYTYIMNLDGTNKTTLIEGKYAILPNGRLALEVGHLIFSPNGGKICYTYGNEIFIQEIAELPSKEFITELLIFGAVGIIIVAVIMTIYFVAKKRRR